jgi:bacillithiol biosynthesis cysteine-adding enzyme BshC
MNKQTISLSDTGQFSSLFLDYMEQKENLQPFFQRFPSLVNFNEQVQSRQFDTYKREVLRTVLREQYAHFPPLVQAQIDSVTNENTFTVTTGHQLNIFGGPLYLIYKLITTINLAKRLQETYPQYHFIPVYWMATEDHDFEEINHFHLFGKKYTWQTAQTGAVGRMNPQELRTVLGEIAEKLPVFEKAYLQHASLAAATRHWVHELFGDQGLLCIDADAPQLKAQFQEAIKADLLEQRTFDIANRTTEQLQDLGYKTQVNAREINFFYLDNQIRERIVPVQDHFQVLNTEISFTKEALLTELEQHPERFSPNVLLRPLYQETILPNLAYIGGPAEVAYWLQLKGIFDAFQTPFPLLMPRNFALVVNKANTRKLDKLCISVSDLFLEEAPLKRKFIECAVPEVVNVEAEKEQIVKAFEVLTQKAVRLDKTLEGFVGAERQKTLHSLENVEKRLKKAEEKNQETGITQLLSIKNKLFPDGQPQERVDNFLNFYLNNPEFLQELMHLLDPLEYRFHILTEDE